jgi:hypothetical protein
MASTDTRGFRYPLEPLRQRRQWQLDAAMAAVAALRKQITERSASRRAVQDESVAQADMASQDWKRRVDPATQAGLLAYLVRLEQTKALIDAEIVTLKEKLAVAQLEALSRQRGVEALQRHRTDALDEYRAEQDRKAAARADQDWTARGVTAAGAGQ